MELWKPPENMSHTIEILPRIQTKPKKWPGGKYYHYEPQKSYFACLQKNCPICDLLIEYHRYLEFEQSKKGFWVEPF